MSNLVSLTVFERRLQRFLEPVLHDNGYELIRLRFGGSTRRTLQIMAERQDGTMTIGNCVELSQTLSPILDVEDLIGSDYSLEVSSPGMDRPLTKVEHFDRWVGFEARLELHQMLDGRRRFKGIIHDVQGNEIHVKVQDETVAIDFSLIASARLKWADEPAQNGTHANTSEKTGD